MTDVSVVIPAFDAGGTLEATLASLLAQTYAGFEAIVVDDGSTDATVAVARRIARTDARVRVVSRPHGGVAAARNAGLAEACGELVLFLDADDLLAPDMLEKTRALLLSDAHAAAAYCGWSRIAADGSIVTHDFFRTTGDLFPVLAGVQPFAIHTCLARRAAVIATGGFDPRLTTSEDWDLWQRVARTGATFLCVPEVLAFYRMKIGSASQDPRRMLEDGLEVVARGARRDPRVAYPLPRWAEGLAEQSLRVHRYRLLSWSAGLAIGQGVPVRPLLDLVGDLPCPELEPHVIADALVQAVLLPGAKTPAAWTAWPELEARLASLVEDIARRARAPHLASGALARLEDAVLEQVTLPARFGRTWAAELDPWTEIRDVEPPEGTERVRLRVSAPDLPRATLVVAPFGGQVPAAVVRDALASELVWPLLRAYFRAHIASALRFEVDADAGSWTAFRGDLELVRGHRAARERALEALLETRGWALFLQEAWGKPDWPESRFYEAIAEPALTVRLSRGAYVLELSDDVPDLELEGEARGLAAIEVTVRVGGIAIGEVRVPVVEGRVGASRLRAEVVVAAGLELARAAVREGLLGLAPGATGSLRERLRARARTTGDPDPPARGHMPHLPRRARRDLDTAVSRRAWLPREAGAELDTAARAAGEPPLRNGHADGPLLYDPGAIEVAAPAEAEPAGTSREPGPRGPDTAHLPILAFHRIAAKGDAADAPYRLSPAALEERLAMLKALGYASVTLADWRRAMVGHTPLRGRAVLLTFDDATADFAEHAWPLLKRYGFGALLFVPTDGAERGRYVDPVTGIEHRALGWADLATLRREGVELGSHTCTHPHLTRLAPVAVVRELAASRARLQERTGAPVHAVAYPFGDSSPLVHHLAGACGYLYGLTSRPARASLWDALLALPRLDVGSDATTIAALASALGLEAPVAEVKRTGP